MKRTERGCLMNCLLWRALQQWLSRMVGTWNRHWLSPDKTDLMAWLVWRVICGAPSEIVAHNQLLASLASRRETISWLRLIGGQFGCLNRNKQKRLKGLCSGKGLRVCLIIRSLHGTPGKQKYWTKRLNAVLSKGRSEGTGGGTFDVVVDIHHPKSQQIYKNHNH